MVKNSRILFVPNSRLSSVMGNGRNHFSDDRSEENKFLKEDSETW